MFRALKQVRSAVGLLNPEEVRKRAERRLTIGLVAADSAGYAQMEELLVPEGPAEGIYRATDPSAPEQFDVVIYQEGLPCPGGAFVFHPAAPDETIDQIIRSDDDIALALARRYLAFRKPVIDRIIQTVARENAFFALATALPNVVPNLIELPWAIGEFASDTAFLTMNQVRMAFLIGAACGRDVGYAEQTTEIVSIAAGAFGWRAIARELAGKIPLGGGLIPKGAIAWAGTYVLGKGMEFFHRENVMPSRQQRRQMYRDALIRGKQVAHDVRQQLHDA